jgi:hypothetical protein
MEERITIYARGAIPDHHGWCETQGRVKERRVISQGGIKVSERGRARRGHGLSGAKQLKPCTAIPGRKAAYATGIDRYDKDGYVKL